MLYTCSGDFSTTVVCYRFCSLRKKVTSITYGREKQKHVTSTVFNSKTKHKNKTNNNNNNKKRGGSNKNNWTANCPKWTTNWQNTCNKHVTEPSQPQKLTTGLILPTSYCGSRYMEHEALRPQKPLRLIRDEEVGGSGIYVSNTYLLATLSPQDWHCTKVGSCVSHFNVSLIVWAKSHDSVHKPPILKRKESRSGSNRSPSAYQPSALPLGHTGSPPGIYCSVDINKACGRG